MPQWTIKQKIRYGACYKVHGKILLIFIENLFAFLSSFLRNWTIWLSTSFIVLLTFLCLSPTKIYAQCLLELQRITLKTQKPWLQIMASFPKVISEQAPQPSFAREASFKKGPKTVVELSQKDNYGQLQHIVGDTPFVPDQVFFLAAASR